MKFLLKSVLSPLLFSRYLRQFDFGFFSHETGEFNVGILQPSQRRIFVQTARRIGDATRRSFTDCQRENDVVGVQQLFQS